MVRYVIGLGLFFGQAYEEVMRQMTGTLQSLGCWDRDWKVPSAPALTRGPAAAGGRAAGGAVPPGGGPGRGPGRHGRVAARPQADGHRRDQLRRARYR